MEAALEAALAEAAHRHAPAGAQERRELLWERLAEATRREDGSRLTAHGSRPGRFKPGAIQAVRIRVAVAACVLGLGLSLAGWWWGEHGGEQPDPAPSVELSLWDPQPLIEDPMGPTTARLLVLLETPP
jgi:hypothetical protein